MNDGELKISIDAINFIKDNKRSLIEKFINPLIHQAAEIPVSLFMAGSPGAGKTEVSKRLIEKFETNKPVRIDPDEIREILPGYIGGNSQLFQSACSIGVDKLYDYVIDNNLSAIIDGTFASEKSSFKNISRSIKHKRKIEIYYIYQEPSLAWEFTQSREAKEGRKITKEMFISAFIDARKNVNKAKEVFNGKIELNLMIKDFNKNLEIIETNINNVDKFLPDIYTGDNLNKLIVYNKKDNENI